MGTVYQINLEKDITGVNIYVNEYKTLLEDSYTKYLELLRVFTIVNGQLVKIDDIKNVAGIDIVKTYNIDNKSILASYKGFYDKTVFSMYTTTLDNLETDFILALNKYFNEQKSYIDLEKNDLIKRYKENF